MIKEYTFSEEFFSKVFKSKKSLKDAYLKATKWVAVNIISRDEFENVQVKYEKDKYATSITIHLFAALNKEEDVMSKHCKICKEMHSSFFINEATHCDKCSARAFQKRLESLMTVKKQYYKELIEK